MLRDASITNTTAGRTGAGARVEPSARSITDSASASPSPTVVARLVTAAAEPGHDSTRPSAPSSTPSNRSHTSSSPAPSALVTAARLSTRPPVAVTGGS